MPRKTTFFIPPDAEVLASIVREHTAALAADEGRGWESMQLNNYGVVYSLERFSGKPCLTAGERSKWQAAIRRLEEQGLLIRFGNRVTPLPDAAAIQEAKATEPSNA